MNEPDLHTLLLRMDDRVGRLDERSVRQDERMEWMVKEMTDHRQDHKELRLTVNGHGKWIHVGKLLVPIVVGVVLARDYIAGWILSARQ